jgi:hypothetical protein
VLCESVRLAFLINCCSFSKFSAAFHDSIRVSAALCLELFGDPVMVDRITFRELLINAELPHGYSGRNVFIL